MEEKPAPADDGALPRRKRRWVRGVVAASVIGLLAIGGYVGPKAVRWIQARRASAELEALVSREMQALVRGDDKSSSQKERLAQDTLNRLVPDVSFQDLSGRQTSLRELRGKVVVVSMTSIQCPISRKLVPALARLSGEFGDGRVQFLMVNTDRDASPGELEDHAGLFPGWRYVPDRDGRVARALSAGTTTETFVLDQAQTLRYRGAVDDRFDVGVNRRTAGPGGLSDAVAAVLNDQPLWLAWTPAPGCLLGPSPDSGQSPAVTWHNQISRLVRYQCEECHRPGEAAPFSLQTREQVVARTAMIEFVLNERIMPPWFADPAHGSWRNVRSVSDADREMFKQWVSAGCPEGDLADAPLPLKPPSGWTIAEPDLVIDVGPQDVPAEGEVEWRKVPIPFEITDDLWVSEAEIRPSHAELMHHAMLFVEYADDDPRRDPRAAESMDGGFFWLSYFPGRKAMILPPGRGKLLPRNARLFAGLHYTPNGTATVDKTRIGLKLLPSAPEKTVVSSAVRKLDFRVPPDSMVHFVHAQEFNEDVRLIALMPHMHYRGSAAQVFLKHPDGRFETLLNVPKFDFDWQVSYEFLKPLLVARGSQIVIRHEFDNRAENPKNPDATRELRHGDQVTDEMMMNFFDWEPAGDGPPPGEKARRSRPFR